MIITKTDLAVALALLAISLAFYPSNTKRLNPALYQGTLGQTIGQPDNWLFDADSASATENMYDRYSDQTLNRRHPLFSVVMIPLTYTTAFVSGRSRIDSGILAFGIVGCLWGAVFYVALTALLDDRLAAVLFALVGMGSASTMFWLSIPERQSLAGLGVVAGLLLLVCAQRVKAYRSALLGASFFVTLGFTLTNGALALLASLATAGWKATSRMVFYAFGVMAIVMVAASVYLPTSAFIGVASLDQSYLKMPGASRLLEVTRSFFLHSMVAPHFGIAEGYPVPVLSAQQSTSFSTNTAGAVATIAWALLLLTIPFTVFHLRKSRSLAIVLGGYVAVQLVLHGVYGRETFLYSANYLPIVVALAALGVKTPLRPVILGLAAVLAAGAILNNTAQWHSVADYTWTLK